MLFQLKVVLFGRLAKYNSFSAATTAPVMIILILVLLMIFLLYVYNQWVTAYRI